MLPIYKTKRKKAPIRTPEGPNGRQVCELKTASGLREYRSRTEQMWDRQKGLCSICNLPMRLDEATFDHDNGRGHGGGHRDDRIWVDGKGQNSAVHGFCNVKKSSIRIDRWREINGTS